LKQRSQFFLVLFFVSGACGLVYEVVWTRLFIVVIGNTVFSVSAILTVFMAGLAIGSRIAGRIIDQRPLPLIQTYAALEAGIAVYNLALPLLLRAFDPLFGTLYASAYQSFLLVTLGRVFIAVVLLIVPATLMGATLPILIRYYVAEIAAVGEEAGRVYTANTWGAAAGTLLAGFVFVPYLGVILSLFLAVGVNLAISVAAWLFSRTADAPSIARLDSPKAGPGIVLVAMLLSGFAALMDEVAWTRVLGLVAGPTTYAFTLMLASMIAGLGIGAALGSRLARRNVTISTLAWVEIVISLASVAILPAFGELPLWIGRIVTRYVEHFDIIQGIEFLIFFGLMLVPATFLGMTFPIASRLYAKSDSLLGSEVSAVYAFNTFGGILGSLAAGFVVIPHLGTQRALIIAAAINAGAAIALMFGRIRWVQLTAALAVIPAAVVIPKWNPELMSSGAYKYAPYYSPRADLESTLTAGELLYFREGATTTVTVRKQHGDTLLAVDGKVDATDSGDMTTQKMLGHLPLLLSEGARNVAIIGLGSGVTAGSALQHPIYTLDVIEISPEVGEASAFFTHVNHEPLKDPRTRLIIGDGRNHLRYTRQSYDVIVSEPSNPWMSGMASLFSREFFQEALARLTPKGIHCQWMHSYNMSLADLRTIVRTFRSVFPHSQLWALNQNDFLLLGSPSRIDISSDALTTNLRHVVEDLKSIGMVDLYSLAALYRLEDADLDTFAGNAPMNTDSHPLVEFHAPRFIYANTSDENFAALTAVHKIVAVPAFVRDALSNATAENHRNAGEMYLSSESFADAIAELKLALVANPDDPSSWRGILRAGRSLHLRPQLTRFIEEKLQNRPSSVVRLAAADFFWQEGNNDRAETLAKSVLTDEPQNISALEKLAEIQMDDGNSELPATVDKLLRLDEQNAKGLYYLATIRFYQRRNDEAIQLVRRSLERDAGNARARNLLAILYGQTFQHDLADAEFRKTIQEFPNDELSRNNYGLYLIERGRIDEAIMQFKYAIEINPEDVQAFVGLGEASRQSGRNREAEHWYRAALRMDPNQPVARQYVH